MWIKLDDGFATHPKILCAGIEALAIQVRAFCYASKNQTDGFIPVQAVVLFVTDLPITPEGWATRMISAGLWELVEGGYQIHDYLEWNCSKMEYEKWKQKLSLAGKRGMKSRYNKDNSDITNDITKVITSPVTSSSTSTSILSSLKSDRKSATNWLEKLRANPLYAHVNWEWELGKMKVWNKKPANLKRKITQSFVINWVNKIEPPLSNGSVSLTHCALCKKDYPDAAALKLHNYSYHPKYEG
jgi:hypothetical protein